MKVIGIIPARMSATRFPRKPMALIHGIPMIGHCYLRSKLCTELEEVYIATCDEEIAEYGKTISAKVIMTSDKHKRASDRAAEAMLHIEESTQNRVEAVVMIQGDEPLILPATLSEFVKKFTQSSADIFNIMTIVNDDEDFIDKNNVKVVVNHQKEALYFSREPIPCKWSDSSSSIIRYIQSGIIGFKREALIRFNTSQETMLESSESIDMNRVLEGGEKVQMHLSDFPLLGVDTPADLEEVALLMEKNRALRL